MDIEERIDRHLRQLAPHVSERETAQILRAALLEINILRSFVQDCKVNWDCDSDAHKYGTRCRACEAEKLLTPNAKVRG